MTIDPLKTESQNAAPQGSGKGTLSARLVQKYDLHFISTGDVLRKEIMQGSEIGREAEEVVKSGGEFAISGFEMLNTDIGWLLIRYLDFCSCINATHGPLFVLIAPGMVLFAGLVSDELMLKIIQSELDKLHGKASPRCSLLSLAPEVTLPRPKSFQTTSDSISYIAHPMTSHFSPSIK